MQDIGNYVIYLIMVCAVLGALATILRPESTLSKEFTAGLNSIGPIFIPVAGVMASLPFISHFITVFIAPLFHALGADPALAGPMFIASDMGGYHLAHDLAESPEGWILGMITGFQSGSTLIFVIPVGLAILNKEDHRYMALGIMAGLLSIPIGIITISMVAQVTGAMIRPGIETTGAATEHLHFTLYYLLKNLSPLIVFCLLLAMALRFFPNAMVYLFLKIGKIVYSLITLVLVASIVEYFTSFFSHVFGGWGFAPIIADRNDQFRALEVAGYVGIMLCGAFPMVHLLRKILEKPIEKVAARLGISSSGATGILAASCNIIAMLRIVKDMPPKDKVIVIAYAVCAAFTFGDHMAYSANFQPGLIFSIIVGKLSGGVAGMLIAYWLALGSIKNPTHSPQRSQTINSLPKITTND